MEFLESDPPRIDPANQQLRWPRRPALFRLPTKSRQESFYRFSPAELYEIARKASKMADDSELEVIGHFTKPMADRSEGGIVNRFYQLTIGYCLTTTAPTINDDDDYEQPTTTKSVSRFLVRPLIAAQERYDFCRQGSDPFDNEAHFYSSVLPMLVANNRAEPFAPRCLLANGFVVVFEDPREQRFEMCLELPPRLPGAYLIAALKALARYHAAINTTERETDLTMGQLFAGESEPDSEVNSSQEDYDDDAAATSSPSVGADPSADQTQLDMRYIEPTLELIEYICCRMSLDESRVRQGFVQAFGSIMNWDQTNKLVKRALNQGDVWPLHMFFWVSDYDAPLVHARITSFNIVPHVPRLLEVAELIQLSTSRSQRRVHEAAMLVDYHGALCRALEENEADPTPPTWEDLRDEYDAVRVAGLYLAFVQLPSMRWSQRDLAFRPHPEMYLRETMYRWNNRQVMQRYERDPPYRAQLCDMCGELMMRLAKMPIVVYRDDQNNRVVVGQGQGQQKQ